MIEAKGLTKRYGKTVAVNDLSFSARSGQVTGFLGPNGAGKSTTMRMILGLDNATAGQATIDGKRYHELRHPLHTVGALLDAKWVHPNRSARAHLAWMAKANGIPKGRVDEVLDTVGLTSVAGKRTGPRGHPVDPPVHAPPGRRGPHGVRVHGIGELAAKHQIVLHELSPRQGSLEQAFMSLTGDAVEFNTALDGQPSAADALVTAR